MRIWLVTLWVVVLMALGAGSAVAGPRFATPAGAEAGQQAAQQAAPPSAAHAASPEALQAGAPITAPAEPAAPLPPVDPPPLDTVADVPALVDGPRPFPLPELQAAAPRRLTGAPAPLPFLEGLRRPPRLQPALG